MASLYIYSSCFFVFVRWRIPAWPLQAVASGYLYDDNAKRKGVHCRIGKKILGVRMYVKLMEYISFMVCVSSFNSLVTSLKIWVPRFNASLGNCPRVCLHANIRRKLCQRKTIYHPRTNLFNQWEVLTFWLTTADLWPHQKQHGLCTPLREATWEIPLFHRWPVLVYKLTGSIHTHHQFA